MIDKKIFTLIMRYRVYQVLFCYIFCLVCNSFPRTSNINVHNSPRTTRIHLALKPSNSDVEIYDNIVPQYVCDVVNNYAEGKGLGHYLYDRSKEASNPIEKVIGMVLR